MGPRKDFPGMRNKENDESGGPTTTVFVGNISEKASDMLIRQLLAVSISTPQACSEASTLRVVRGFTGLGVSDL